MNGDSGLQCFLLLLTYCALYLLSCVHASGVYPWGLYCISIVSRPLASWLPAASHVVYFLFVKLLMFPSSLLEGA